MPLGTTKNPWAWLERRQVGRAVKLHGLQTTVVADAAGHILGALDFALPQRAAQRQGQLAERRGAPVRREAVHNTNRWNIRKTDTGLPGRPKTAFPAAEA